MRQKIWPLLSLMLAVACVVLLALWLWRRHGQKRNVKRSNLRQP